MKLKLIELSKAYYSNFMHRHQNYLIALSFLFLLPLFSACSHSPTNNSTDKCQELDWYELGRQDGTKGLTNNSRREVKALCEESDQSLSEALYHNGFDSGVSQYCTIENGFELGRSGKPISNVCPPLMMDDFTKNYTSGQRYTEIKKLQSTVDIKINDIENHLDDKKLALMRRALLRSEKIQLEDQKKSLADEMKSISRR